MSKDRQWLFHQEAVAKARALDSVAEHKEALDKAERHYNAAIVRAYLAKASLREIAEYAGTSHERVRVIAKGAKAEVK